MTDRQADNPLVGGLAAALWENRAADGQVTYPMGTDALGSLLYSADGRFSVMISRSGRTLFATGDLLRGTTEEQAQAVEGLWATRAAIASMATESCITWSCRCSPLGR